VFYDTDPADGYQWIQLGSFGLAGSGGADGNTDWSLTENDQFPVYVYGYSEHLKITSGQLYGDNFGEMGAVPKAVRSTNHEELGGGESKVTGVASVGLKSYVAVSGQGGDGNWYGQLRIYKPSGALYWASDPFDLLGGRTTQVAVSGSKVYVTGYQGIAGSGEENVFVRAYDASTRAFKWEYSVDGPNAGLYPVGVVASSSYLVGFFNTRDAGTEIIRGKVFGLYPVTGGLKWSGEFNDDSLYPSNKINAIVMKGTKFAAAGYQEDESGVKSFSVRTFSAVNGDWALGYWYRPLTGGQENEALAVDWKGSIIGVAGYVSPDPSTRNAHVWAIPMNALPHHVDYVENLGNDSRCTGVVVSGTKIYASGYGMDGSEQKTFVRAYDTTKDYPDAMLWSDTFDLTSLGGMVTTGMTLASKRIYVSGYGLGLSGTPDWFVKAYDLNGHAKWLDDFNLNGGQDSKAYGIASSSNAVTGTSAIVAVGQAKNGPDGAMEMAVRTYRP
jgi:hypothetical protein